MKRNTMREEIRKVEPINLDFDILYCSHDLCPLNSLYNCNYCNKYYCINHIKFLEDINNCICKNCINNNNVLFDIYHAIQLNNANKNPIKNRLKYFCSFEWVRCTSKIEPI